MPQLRTTNNLGLPSTAWVPAGYELTRDERRRGARIEPEAPPAPPDAPQPGAPPDVMALRCTDFYRHPIETKDEAA